jgi:hypothetical protein
MPTAGPHHVDYDEGSSDGEQVAARPSRLSLSNQPPSQGAFPVTCHMS